VSNLFHRKKQGLASPPFNEHVVFTENYMYFFRWFAIPKTQNNHFDAAKNLEKQQLVCSIFLCFPLGLIPSRYNISMQPF